MSNVQRITKQSCRAEACKAKAGGLSVTDEELGRRGGLSVRSHALSILFHLLKLFRTGSNQNCGSGRVDVNEVPCYIGVLYF